MLQLNLRRPFPQPPDSLGGQGMLLPWFLALLSDSTVDKDELSGRSPVERLRLFPTISLMTYFFALCLLPALEESIAGVWEADPFTIFPQQSKQSL